MRAHREEALEDGYAISTVSIRDKSQMEFLDNQSEEIFDSCVGDTEIRDMRGSLRRGMQVDEGNSRERCDPTQKRVRG